MLIKIQSRFHLQFFKKLYHWRMYFFNPILNYSHNYFICWSIVLYKLFNALSHTSQSGSESTFIFTIHAYTDAYFYFWVICEWFQQRDTIVAFVLTEVIIIWKFQWLNWLKIFQFICIFRNILFDNLFQSEGEWVMEINFFIF